jgi:hypothetical protein
LSGKSRIAGGRALAEDAPRHRMHSSAVDVTR